MSPTIQRSRAHTPVFCVSRVERVFAQCFLQAENTLLCGGADEPLYAPSTQPGEPHRLWFREDYFASALHETAHWCIAGAARRQQLDFGYWYAPEGRDPAAQAAFESVEVRPQALEWCFSIACGYPFRISTDNLAAGGGETGDHSAFESAVRREALRLAGATLPRRAAVFFRALQAEFDKCGALTPALVRATAAPSADR
ncbi:MAG: elongation factor P hydroxylase [Halieaceae bacterium]|uniref:elongation factor P hydroxylase n=1 Tax=Haliea alexandrii TaxID=2448162 RepID=UPI000F0BB087|nr:elongation factor P hydroxylase [Haliea alexandrii]MCR9184907.1 elongation factor P hydroxylase [Halieaceae bacterium]